MVAVLADISIFHWHAEFVGTMKDDLGRRKRLWEEKPASQPRQPAPPASPATQPENLVGGLIGSFATLRPVETLAGASERRLPPASKIKFLSLLKVTWNIFP